MKKFLSLVVAALLTVSAVATSATAAKFTDVDATNEALNEAVELLIALNLTKGTTDTTFGTEENVTRQQMATFMYRIMNDKVEATNFPNNTTFADLVDPYYNFVISWANEKGIIKGTKADGTAFNPTGSIVLMDAYTMAVRALGYDDGTLSYPIGYIGKAEDLGLDENLPSTLGYSDTLTRGDVAIILANMLYAETAEVKVGYATTAPDANGMTTTYPVEYHQTLIESVFNVSKETYRVVSTKTYAFGEYNQNNLAVEMIEVEKDGDGVRDASAKTIMFADLGLEGTSDDYFLLDLAIYEKDGKIFSASALGTKETVDASEVVLTPKKWPKTGTGTANMSGISEMFTIKGVESYFFNAPYTYAGDVDGGYDFNNVKVIVTKDSSSTTQVDYDFHYVVPMAFFDTPNGWAPASYAGYALGYDPSASGSEGGVVGTLARGALGEYDIYDSDGDGKYDYMFAKPYIVGKIDTTENKKIADNKGVGTVSGEDRRNQMTVGTNPLYTAATTMDPSSVEYKKDDIVIAYIDLAANYMKVVEVLDAPVKASIKAATATGYTLSDDTEIVYSRATYAVWNGINASNGIVDSLDTATANMGTDLYFYMYNGKVVYSTAVTPDAPAGFDPTTAWAIVLDGTLKPQYSLVGTDLISVNTIKVYMDGKVQSVKVKDGSYTALENVLATAKVDKDGFYTFTADATASTTAGLETSDKTAIKVVKGSTTTTITKNANGSFALAGEDLTGVYALEGAQFIIRSKDAEGNVIVNAYTADTLPAIAQTFTSASYVLTNNVNSTKYENVGVFYGYYNGVIGAAGATATKNMVLMGGISNAALVDHDNNPDTAAMVERTYMTYELGAKPAAVTGKNLNATYNAVFGDLFVLDSEGELDDTAKIGNLFAAGNMYEAGTTVTSGYGYKKVANYDPTSNLVELKNADDSNVDGEYYITKNTVISLAKNGGKTITMSKVDAISETKAGGAYANTLGGNRAAFIVYETTATAGVYNIVNLVIVVD